MPCAAPRSSPSRAPAGTWPRRSARARGCSRCTCRSAATTRVTRCSARAGGRPPGRFTGPGPISEVLARHPRLVMIIAHLGSPEYGAFLGLAERYPGVYLDTTMAFTDFFEHFMPFPRALRPRLAALADRVLLGSDFPNIPYPYLHQLEALARLDLGAGWLRAVCHDNATRLLGL